MKSEILQNYVKAEFGCENMICVDINTRWNRLSAVLESFLEIKSAISKALIDIKEEQILTNVEFETLTAIETGLKPVKIGLEKLCSRKRLFTFIIRDLNQQYDMFSGPKN
ncbi:hypothetical protein AVEN_152398-1 [Araneus ventricosus]|uniref:Zinc finger BED domain-containing protein 4 n=1 Tax=Araneus ventricosus TaxID=182803 RepID=A0A4Y2DB87_ARAVE|nr:hypothetical protein AVEN_152398-1 [Araneus ventricosus]